MTRSKNAGTKNVAPENVTPDELSRIADNIATECLAVRIRKLGRVVTALYDRGLRRFDIRVGQVSILVLLCRHTEATPLTIGRELEMEKSTVSRNLGRMQKKGWITITPAPPRGNQIIELTGSGRELLAAIYREWAEAQTRTRDLLGADGTEALYRIFAAMKRNKAKDVSGF